MSTKLNRAQLIQLVTKIIEVAGTEEEVDQWLSELSAGVIDPEVTDYIYYPDREMTPEEIVDRALAYRPIQL